MVFEKDYGKGFVRFPKEVSLFHSFAGIIITSSATSEAFQTHRCVQDFLGKILLSEEDSKAILSRMSLEDFQHALDGLTKLPKTVEVWGDRHIVVEPETRTTCKICLICQPEVLMNAVREYLLTS